MTPNLPPAAPAEVLNAAAGFNLIVAHGRDHVNAQNDHFWLNTLDWPDLFVAETVAEAKGHIRNCEM
ncbi:MAG: hypothetical protein LC799_02155, partial [Actinobacteria bacterium]|nr:hypothetical protein [Actinomycetota bacterium]